MPDFVSAGGRAVAGQRVGVLDDPYHREAAPGVRAAFEAACDVLRWLGLRLEPVAFPTPEEARAAQLGVMMPEAACIHERWIEARGQEYGPATLALLRQGLFVTATQYLRAQQVRALIADEVDALLVGRIALVSPTVPITATAIGQDAVTFGGRSTDARGVISRITRLVNLIGLPAISVPCGFDGDGLPVGLQIVGRRRDEPSIIAIAAAYERATPWHGRRPPEPAR
jgi:aspartyl-tRNA(Asn)/glutamyl-tRNA(Gln) amidotransferase subunit A